VANAAIRATGPVRALVPSTKKVAPAITESGGGPATRATLATKASSGPAFSAWKAPGVSWKVAAVELVSPVM